MTDEHIPVTPLSQEESWALLAGRPVGRLATSVAGKPDIFPVNYVLDGGDIVVRTERGSKLVQLTINDQVAFEVDDWREGVGGWSVVCQGHAEQIDTAAGREHAESLDLVPWVTTMKTIFVRIRVSHISGRSFRFDANMATPDIEPED